MELLRVTALNEKRIRVMPIGQEDATRADALRPETIDQRLRRLLAAAVGIGIERDIDGAGAFAELLKLVGVDAFPTNR